MFAIIGLPGSVHHRYRWFHRSERAEAETWLQSASDDLAAIHPAAHPQPTRLISDRDASRERYRDGTRIYHQEDSSVSDQPYRF
jgi:hypothetical protein